MIENDSLPHDPLPKVSDALDLSYDEPELPIVRQNTQPAVISEDEKIKLEHEKYDYDKAREIYHSVAHHGLDALDTLTKIGKTTSEPRSYEVLASLMRSLNETAKQLKELHAIGRPVSKVADSKENDKSEVNIDKAVFFSGTQSELLKALRNGNGTVG
jgi:hypothetical protein